ncbi:hypothetical protein BDW72DRAFT_206630 [Aspergillus terricola var. indicus]
MSTTLTKEETTPAVVKTFDDTAHSDLQYAYSAYLPVYDTTTTFPPTEPFDHRDRGLNADKSKPHLFQTGGPAVSITKLTPRVGSEVRGLQLSQLSDRGVVVFRDQDFKDIGPEKQKEFASYFGRLHVHPVEAHVKDHIEFHHIYLGADNLYRLQTRLTKLSKTGYHSDVVPSSGCDTAWVSRVAAYERLSDSIKRLLEGLGAEHSGFPQAERARADGKFVRREPMRSEHPVVRVHPVTGEKALFVNPGFTKRIIGLKDEESVAILQLLFKHVSLSQDIQVRVKWDNRTVSLWDNRVTAHTAISDYDTSTDGLRHGNRLTTLGEKPVGVDGLETVW